MGFFFLSLVLLIFGLARNELLASILGITLVLVLLYAYASTFVLEAVHRRRGLTVHAAVAEHPPGPGEAGTLQLTLPRAASPLPAVEARWRVEFRFHERNVTLERPAGVGGRERWTLHPPERGLYDASGVMLCFADRFGFARTELHYPGRLELQVSPKPWGEGGRRPHSAGSAARMRQGRSLRRNELLIESRPYHPGDDLRRLNWKALARTDELLVRIGEEIPPARRWVALVCDPGHCCDAVAEAAAELLLKLESQGYRCRLVNGATGEEANEREWKRFLASLWDSLEPPAAAVDLAAYPAAILLTPRPATARREAAVRSALAKGGGEIQEVRCPEGKERRSSLLRRILFVPGDRT